MIVIIIVVVRITNVSRTDDNYENESEANLFGLNLRVSTERICVLGSQVFVRLFLPFLVHGLWNVSHGVVREEQGGAENKANSYTLVDSSTFFWTFHWLSWAPRAEGDVPCSLLFF